MVEPTLLSTLDSGTLTLTLNRPAKLNAINNALATALLEVRISAIVAGCFSLIVAGISA